MGYKLPDRPTIKASVEELADFWEIQCLKHNNRPISKIEIIKNLSITSDEIENEGIESEEDDLDIELDRVFDEINYRIKACGNAKYPFILNNLSLRIKEDDDIYKTIYKYLLYTTRLNMLRYKIFNNIDGTLLFEELCAIAGKQIFGHGTNGKVFGTAASSEFREKVEDLIRSIGEGNSFVNRDYNTPTAKDDGLDVVFWKNFEDKKEGKLIGFGQCKTGTSWRDSISKLNPEKFTSNWFRDQPILKPIPIVFLSDTQKKGLNFLADQRGKLFLNRFRILSYISEDFDEAILERISSWNLGADDYLSNN